MIPRAASLAFVAALALTGCAEPVVVERHHYHTHTERRPVYVNTPARPAPAVRKSSPSVSSESAESFRAIERPGSYSQ
jgi:hypothetical protein